MTDWQLVKEQARKFLESKTEWTSFIHHKRYQILNIEDRRLIIEKVSGGKNVVLTENLVNRSAAELKGKKAISKGNLIENSVSRETAFVYLHPFVGWNLAKREFFWNDNYVPSYDSVNTFIVEASDDDLEKVLRQINKRNNGSKFRENLLTLYKNKCCISGTDTQETLEAAHILQYSLAGVNDSTNGLLLRADLHILFDKELLLIHPTLLTVHLHPKLIETEYYKLFHNKTIDNRIDSRKPNEVYLKQRWNNVSWIEPVD